MFLFFRILSHVFLILVSDVSRVPYSSLVFSIVMSELWCLNQILNFKGSCGGLCLLFQLLEGFYFVVVVVFFCV